MHTGPHFYTPKLLTADAMIGRRANTRRYHMVTNSAIKVSKLAISGYSNIDSQTLTSHPSRANLCGKLISVANKLRISITTTGHSHLGPIDVAVVMH